MIQITRSGKFSLSIASPVMPAAGAMGFANTYYTQVDQAALGAFVTNPVTFEPWSPAAGTRVVPLDAGVLIHSGLPNAGLSRTIKEYRQVWMALAHPVILHLVATDPDHIRRAVERIDHEESIMAIELGLGDDLSASAAADLIRSATDHAEKPILARLPVYDAYEIAPAAVDAGADALVIAAPPRGTARDPRTGRLVSGRVYGPMVKPMVLRLVAQLAGRIDTVPIIGAGGIHSVQDARDYLEAGAVAVQLDSVTWIEPSRMAEITQTLAAEHHATSNQQSRRDDISAQDFRRMFSDDD